MLELFRFEQSLVHGSFFPDKGKYFYITILCIMEDFVSGLQKIGSDNLNSSRLSWKRI